MPIGHRVASLFAVGLALSLLSSEAAAQPAVPTPAPPIMANPAIYSEVIPTSSGLPFDPANDTQESFTAPNGKTVQVLVKGPVGPGTYSRPMKDGETADSYFPAVVQEAVAANAHKLVIPRGTYAFQGPTLCQDLQSAACKQPSSCNVNQYWNCSPHWTIGAYPNSSVTTPDSITDLEIDLSGSVLNFSAPVIGIWIVDAQRVRLKNFTLDWPALRIASLGTIVADPANPGHNALVIDNAYPVDDSFTGGKVQIQAVDIWDGGANTSDPPGRFDRKSNNLFETYFMFGNAPQPTYLGKTAAGDQTFSCQSCNFTNSTADSSCSFFNGCANFDGFAPGTRVVIRHYTYNGFAVWVNWSNDIDIENAKLLTGPGMGFAVGSNGGFRGFRLSHSAVERAPGRLISTASDAINIGLQADSIIDNDTVAYQGDDGINIHPLAASISGVHAENIEVAAACDPDPMDSPVVGDTLAFFNPDFSYLGSAHVSSSSGPNCGALKLALDKAIAGLTTTDQFVDLTQQPGARYIVRDNTFRENRGHGVIVNAAYGLISHNKYSANSMGAILLVGGNGNGPGASNVVIANNTINAPGQSAESGGAVSIVANIANGDVSPAPLFQKIVLSDNTISAAPGPAIVVTSTSYLAIGPTTIVNSNQVQASPVDYGTRTSTDSIVIYRASHGRVCGTQRSGSKTGPIGIDPSDLDVSLGPACP